MVKMVTFWFNIFRGILGGMQQQFKAVLLSSTKKGKRSEDKSIFCRGGH
jgi:hypothetical protein